MKTAIQDDKGYYHGRKHDGMPISCYEEKKEFDKKHPEAERWTTNQWPYDEFLASWAGQMVRALRGFAARGRCSRAMQRAARKFIFSENNEAPLSFVGILKHFDIDPGRAMKELEKYR